MEISVEEIKPDVNRSGLLSTVLQVAHCIANWLIGFFMLSKEEQLQAGIDFSGEGRSE